jgi:hypothetical protein
MQQYRNLMAIQAADPDGGERKPTEKAYADHQAWAVATFGRATWDVYRAGGWGHLGVPGGGYYEGHDMDDYV